MFLVCTQYTEYYDHIVAKSGILSLSCLPWVSGSFSAGYYSLERSTLIVGPIKLPGVAVQCPPRCYLFIGTFRYQMARSTVARNDYRDNCRVSCRIHIVRQLFQNMVDLSSATYGGAICLVTNSGIPEGYWPMKDVFELTTCQREFTSVG